jgi:DMSO/TMAO reductase YedYZ heme-binding membrane subunit
MEKEPTQSNSEFSDNLGKLLLDLAKLTFASFILGGILKGELPQNVLIIAGIIAFMVFTVIGLALTSRKKNRG